MTWQWLAAGSFASTGLVLTWLIQSTVLLVGGLLAGRIMRRRGPAVQSALYRTTLVAVMLCPVASMTMAAMGFDGLLIRLPGGAGNDVSSIGSESPDRKALPALQGQEATTDRLVQEQLPAEARPTFTSTPLGGQEGEAVDRASKPIEAETAPIPPTPAFQSWLPSWADSIVWGNSLILAAWLLGSVVLGMRLVVGHRRMARVRSSAVDAEPDVLALCHQLARRMQSDSPSVLRTPFLSSPCLDGLRRPAILLPEDAKENLRETFVHELAHLARHDGLWNLLRQTVTAVFWVQPLCWLLSKRLEETAEEVCDDYVVELGADRSRYAGHLLELAERRLPPLAPSGVGMISLRSLLARRIARILDSTRNLSTQAGWRAIVATLLAGVAGTLLVGLLGVGEAQRKAEAQSASKAAEPKAQPETETIRGQVVAPDGKPFPAATVIAGRGHRVLNAIGDERHPDIRYETIMRKLTDHQGRFELPAGEAWSAIATAPGFGVGYYLKGQPIRLTPGDLPIKGRLIDLEGHPVAGATIRLGQIYVLTPRMIPGAGSPKNPGSEAGRLILNAEPLLPDGIVSDADGRFRIDGLGRDVMADLRISGPTITPKRVHVLTKSMNRVVDEGRDASVQGLDDPTIYGADCTIVVESSRPIEGIVRDAETMEPIPGAVVTASALSGSRLSIDGQISAKTDAHGHYRLLGLPKERGEGHKLSVYPPLDRPYFITRRMQAPAGPGFEPLKFDIALKRGIWITGKVTERDSGKPVRAAVDYFPFLTNAHAKDYPNFDPNVAKSIAINTRYKTDPEGRFRITGLPGGGVVTAHTGDKSYRVGVGAEAIKGRLGQGQLLTYDHIFPNLYQGLKEVDVPDGTGSFACDLALDAGRSVLVRIVDTSGAPVKHASVQGRFPVFQDGGDSNLHDASVIRIAGLVESRSRTVLIQHSDRKIGALLNVSGDDVKPDAELTVTLRPTATVTGRLVDATGKPATGGVRVALFLPTEGLDHRITVGSSKLDAEGRFRCDDIPAGGSYHVNATNRLVYGFGRRMEPEAFASFDLDKDLKLEPGQVVDFGTVDVTTGRRVQDRKTTQARPDELPITGRIVDLEGRPVVGATVQVTQIRKPKGKNLDPWIEAVQRGEHWTSYDHLIYEPPITPEEKRPTATTDRQGRFRIEGLAAERLVELAIRGLTIAYTPLKVVTRRIPPIPARGFPSQHGPGFQTIYGSDFTVTAAPGRPVEGTIRDARTNQLLAGVGVQSDSFAGSDFVGTGDLKTTTDAQGRFRLVGLPKGLGNSIIAVPNDDQPYFMQKIVLADPPGIAPVSVEIGLHRGIFIEGKVIEKATGQPVPKAWLEYFPFLDNTFAQATPEFASNVSVAASSSFQGRYQSKTDGSYRLVGLPGRAIIGVVVYSEKPYLQGAGSESIKGMDKHGYFPTYRNPVPPGKLFPTSMKEINPPEGAKVVHLDLELMAGAKVRLRAVDLQGRPVTGVKVAGRTGRDKHDREPQKESEFDVVTLAPGEDRMVLVRHPERKLGKVVHVRERDDKNGPVIVTLEPSATITGRVSDADGNPVSGASIQIYPQPGGEFSLRLDRVASNKEGRFVVSDVPIGCKYTLVAESGIAPKESRVAFFKNATVRPGESTDVGEVRFEPSTPQTTQSKPAIDRVGVNAMADKSKEIAPKAAEPSKMPIAGRIVDLEGRPVAGATVQIRQITKPKGDDLTPWIEAVKRGEPPWTAYNHLVYEPPISPEDKRPKATTDAQGRFRFDSVAAERLVELVIQGPTIAFTPVEVITRRVEPIPASGFPSQHGPGSQTIHGADFTFTAVPGRPVEGIIRDAKTNQPMAGVEVRSEHFAGSNFAGINDLRTRTDAQGHFRLVGFPKGRGNQLLIVPNDDQPYFMQEVDVPDPLGIAPVPVEIALHMGIWIQGKVTDKETGKPVPGTWLHYFPFLDNKFAQATPEFGPNREVDGTTYQDRYQTKADGTYRLVGLRGRAIVGAVSRSEKPYLRGAGFESIKGMDQKGILPTYFNPVYISRFFPNSMKEINPPDGAEVVHVDLELYSGAKARLRVVDSQGQPVVGVKAAGRIGRGEYDRKHQEAEFDVLNLAPGEDRMVLVQHEGQKLGKAVHVHEGDDKKGPVTIALEPLATITGRVMDADGNPVSGATVRTDPHPQSSGGYSLSLGHIASDKDGKFVVPDVPTGCDYTLACQQDSTLKAANQTVFREAKVRPGESTDVGEIRFGTSTTQATQSKPAIDRVGVDATAAKSKETATQAPEPSKKPANPRGVQARTMPITGRIVDLEGRPVVGATVQIRQITKPKGDDLTPWIEAVKRGEPPWIAYNHLVYEPPITPEDKRPKATTDVQGRFRLDSVAAERLVELVIQGSTITFTPVELITRRTEPIPAPGYPSHHGSGFQTIYGPDFAFTVAPGRPVEGVVRDAKTKQPMTDVEVRSEHFAGSNWGGIRDLTTRTDAQGHFRLVGMPKGRGNQLLIVPNDEQPYFMQEVNVPDPTGLAPVPLDIALHKGIWIQGKVSETETGKPVEGAWLHYLPFLENPFAQATPEFGPDRNVDGTTNQGRYKSQADGTYRLVGLPGRAIVGVVVYSDKPYLRGAGSESIKGMDKNGNFPTYFNPVWAGRLFPTSMKEINPPDGAEAVHLDLELFPGSKLRIRVVDSQGQPVTGVKVSGRIARDRRDQEPQKDAEFDVVTLAPGEDRVILVQHEGRKLGKAVHVHEGDDKKGPVIIALEPLATITGRASDADGNPVSGATIRCQPSPQSPGGFSLNLGQFATGEGGKFTLSNVPTGCDYQLYLESRGGFGNAKFARCAAKVRPGETTDVGEIQFKND